MFARPAPQPFQPVQQQAPTATPEPHVEITLTILSGEVHDILTGVTEEYTHVENGGTLRNGGTAQTWW